MRTLLVLVLTIGGASTAAAQTPGAYEATHHGRVISCYGHAYAIVELVDVATKNLYLVAAEAAKDATPERQNIVAGMLASGTLNDQQQALDVAVRLDSCVSSAIERATQDAGATLAAEALREEVIVAITMADGFASDYRQSSPVLGKFLTAGNDAALQAATARAFSGFGDSLRTTLVRVRLQVDELIDKSKVTAR